MIYAIVYYAFCAGVVIATDDGKRWNWKDHLLLIFAWAYTPYLVGAWVGIQMKRDKVFMESKTEHPFHKATPAEIVEHFKNQE